MAEPIIINLDINGFILRSWLPNDLYSMAKYANNKKILLNLRDEFPFPYSEQHAAEFIRRAYSSNDSLDFAIANY